MMTGTSQLRVGHETAVWSRGCPTLHVFTLPAGDSPAIGAMDALGAQFAAVAAPVGLRDIKPFAKLLEEKRRTPWWSRSPDPVISPSNLDRGIGFLIGSLRAIETERNLAEASLASLVVSPKVDDRSATYARQAVAALSNQLAEETSDLDFELAQNQVLLRLAVASGVASGSAAADRVRSYGRYEIPFALSPPTRAARLEELIAGVRMLALLPLAPGAIETTSELGHGQFVAAGEFAVAGVVVTGVLSAGVALAERVLAWGQQRK